MICEDCKHSFIYFYCWSCKNRLIKNGSYWSYHAFQALEPLDIQCPHCAKFWYQKNVYNEPHVEQISQQIKNDYKAIEFKNYDEAIRYIKKNK